jgi:hypothetical protein
MMNFLPFPKKIVIFALASSNEKLKLLYIIRYYEKTDDLCCAAVGSNAGAKCPEAYECP